MITTRVLGLVHELCLKRIHVTKRDLFYTDVKLFEVGHVPIFKRPLLLSDLCKQGSEVLGHARGSFSSPIIMTLGQARSVSLFVVPWTGPRQLGHSAGRRGLPAGMHALQPAW